MKTETVMIDPARLVFKMNSGSFAEAVFDRGIPLTPSGDDYPSLSALMNAEIVPGHFATCQIAGLLRVGAMPDGDITADAA